MGVSQARGSLRQWHMRMSLDVLGCTHGAVMCSGSLQGLGERWGTGDAGWREGCKERQADSLLQIKVNKKTLDAFGLFQAVAGGSLSQLNGWDRLKVLWGQRGEKLAMGETSWAVNRDADGPHNAL